MAILKLTFLKIREKTQFQKECKSLLLPHRTLGHYLSHALPGLNPRVQLTGTASARVGYPLAAADHFFSEGGGGHGHLCPSSYGDKEAAVVCRYFSFFFLEKLTFFPI